jgi:hypothetical protein
MKELTKFGSDYTGQHAGASQRASRATRRTSSTGSWALITGGQTANAVDASTGA